MPSEAFQKKRKMKAEEKHLEGGSHIVGYVLFIYASSVFVLASTEHSCNFLVYKFVACDEFH